MIQQQRRTHNGGRSSRSRLTWSAATVGLIALLVCSVLVPASHVRGAGLALPLRGQTQQGSVAVLAITPATAQIAAGDTVTITVQVQAGVLQIDGGAAYLDFDPALLQVEQIIPAGPLGLVIQNSFDNVTGRVNYAAGTLDATASGTFDLMRVRFRGLAAGVADVTFQRTQPRSSDVTAGGNSVLGDVVAGAITVTAGSGPTATPTATPTHTPTGQPNPTPTLQPGGALLSIVPLTGAVTAGSVVTVTVQVQAGGFQVDGAAAYLDFDPALLQVEQITPAGPLSLAIQNSFVNGAGRVDYAAGTLDAAASGTFDLVQIRFRGLAAGVASLTFQRTPPRSSDITASGASVLSSVANGTVVVTPVSGPTATPTVTPTATATRTPTPSAGNAALVLVPMTSQVTVGSLVTVTIQVQAGDLLIDGAAAYLDFDPAIVQVEQMTAAGPMTLVIQSSFDNATGRINYAAGTFGAGQTGSFDLLQVRFRGIAVGTSALTFQHTPPRNAEITANGVSVLGSAGNGAITVIPAAPPTATLTPTPTATNTPTATPTLVLPRVRFHHNTYVVLENAGPAVITVTLSSSTDVTVTVNYTVGTAAGKVTFAPRVTLRTFTVPVVNNNLDGPNKNVALVLSNPTNAILGTSFTATLMITDDEPPPRVRFQNSIYTVLENGGAAAILVTLSGGSNLTITVDYTAGATPGLVIFPPGVTSRTFSVPVVNNNLDGPTKYVALALSRPVNALLGTSSTATLFIYDDDPTPLAGFKQAAYSVMENAGVASIAVTLSNASSYTVTVDYSAGTATGRLIFSPGVTQRNFAVSTANNHLDEPDRQVALALSRPVNAFLGSPAAATLMIVDDEATPRVRFNSSAYTIMENAGVAAIKVSLDRGSTLTVTARYTAGASVGEVVFPPGVTQRTFDVPVVDNALDGPNKNVPLALGSPTNALLGASSTATLIITDDEPAPQVRFSSANYSVLENAGAAVITVTLSGGSNLNVTVNYAAGTATGRLIFAPGVTQRTFTVAAPNNNLFGPNKDVALTLNSPVNAVLGVPAAATLTIIDDEGAPLARFGSTGYSVLENAGAATVTVTLSSGSSHTTTVHYTADGAPGQVIFAPGVTETAFTVPVADGATNGPDEVIALQLDPSTDMQVGDASTVALVVMDDDPPPTLEFAGSTLQVEETGATVVATVTLSAPSAYTVRAAYDSAWGTGQLVFPPGETMQHIRLAVERIAAGAALQMALHSPEHANLGSQSQLAVQLPPAEPSPLPTPPPATPTDDVEATLAIVPITSQLTVSTTLLITVVIDTGSHSPDAAAAYIDFNPGLFQVETVTPVGPFDVVLQNAFDNQGGRIDYAAGTFTAATPGMLPLVEVRLHAVAPGTGAFDFSRTLPRSSDVAAAGASVLGDVVGATITVDAAPASPQVRFSAAAYTVSESGGLFAAPVTLEPAAAVTVTAPYTAGLVTGALVFPPGSTAQELLTPVNDDALYEADEQILLELGAPLGAGLGAPATALLTIVDDDAPPSVQFSAGAFAVSESAGSAVLSVTLSAASGLPVTVTYLAGTESEELVFPPGATMQEVVAPVIDDLINSPPATRVLALANPVGATLGETAVALLTILDDDPAPAIFFNSAAYTATEDSGAAAVAVVLSGASGFTVTAAYTAGAASGVLAFAPGVTVQEIVAPVVDDDSDGPDTIIPLALGAAEHATPGEPATALLTVLDNDPQPLVSFASAVYEASAGADVNLDVLLDGASGFTVTVAYSLVETAPAAADAAAPVTGVLVFAPGERQQQLVVAWTPGVAPARTLAIHLTEALHAQLGALVSATLNIHAPERAGAVYLPLITQQ